MPQATPIAHPHTCVKVTSPALRMWSFRSCQDALMGKLCTTTR